MAWTRYEGRALADATLVDQARDAQLEDHIRKQNPHLTDVRLAKATATDAIDTNYQSPRRWYTVAYFAEGGSDQ